MNNHWRLKSVQVERYSDLDDPWPDHITLMPLTRAQKRTRRNANIIRYGAIALGLIVIAFFVVKGI